eukprot:tig00020964_g16805.t1
MSSTGDGVCGEDCKLQIRTLGSEHEREAAWLCAEGFTGPEAEQRGGWPRLDSERSGAVQLRATEELCNSWTRGLAEQAARSGTSAVALEGGRVVGVALNEDYDELGPKRDEEGGKPGPEPGQPPSDYYCVELLRELRVLYASRYPDAARPGQTLHIAGLVVAPTHGRRGLASRLVAASEEAARRAGIPQPTPSPPTPLYRFAVAEASNPLSQRVFLKNGYRVEAAIPYAQWRHASGLRPYAATDPSLSCTLVIKEL